MSNYCTYIVKIAKEDIAEFLTNFYDKEEIENMDLQEQGYESLNGILQDQFSDFMVIDKDTVVGEFD